MKKLTKKQICLLVASLVILCVLFIARPFFKSGPVVYDDPVEHFKYGSVGSDNLQNGLPYWVFQVLPEMFPEHLPQNGMGGWRALGLVVEEGKDTPVGFSRRRKSGIDLVGMNCAVCHATSYRETPESRPQIALGVAHSFDFAAWLQFLFSCAADERFNVSEVMAAIEKKTSLPLAERFVYKRAIKQMKGGIAAQQEALSSVLQLAAETPFGPGRIDVLGPLRAVFFKDPLDPEKDSLATVDFPAIWNQKDREGMNAHWDGNNSSIRERNISASIGVGATPDSLDFDGIDRVEKFLKDTLKPLPYPKQIDRPLAAQGAQYYARSCASCHALGGEWTGEVDPLDKVLTDPWRTNAVTPEIVKALNSIGEGKPWKFSHFRQTDGYANLLLDGIWLRAPYLHNGSVPTLWHLFEKPEDRPQTFSRGSNLYDWEKVGWEWRKDKAEGGGVKHFDFDTRLKGNSNSGHLYGTELPRAEKDAIIEYMKTL